MRNKMLARRIAIAMLSAATVMTAAPVGAFAATTVSVESSNTKTADAKDGSTFKSVISVTAQATAGSASATNEQTIATAIAGEALFKTGALATKPADTAAKTNLTTGTPAAGITLATDYTVDPDSISVSGDVLSFNVKKGVDEVYNISVNYAAKVDNLKDATAGTDAEAVYVALQQYFADKAYDTYDSKTLTNGYVANDVTTNKTKIFGSAIAAKVTVNGNTSALGSDGAGKLNVTITGDKTYEYDFTAKVNISTDSDAKAFADALAIVTANTYPSGATTTSNGKYASGADETALAAKLNADLKAAGYTGTKTLGFSGADALNASYATKDNDGSVYGVIGTTPVSIKLTYSSAQKQAATLKSLSDGVFKDRNASGTVLVNTVAANGYYEFKAGSALAQSVQKTGATVAAESDAVVSAVKDAVDAQLKKDGLDTNGVKVEASNVTDKSKVTVNGSAAETTEATKADAGTYYVLVKTSIANDYAGWKLADGTTYAYDGTTYDGENANDVRYDLVKVDTAQLDQKAATSLALEDKTVELNDAYTNSSTTKKDGTLISLKATLTPADANSTVKYVVKDADGNKVFDNTGVNTGIQTAAAAADGIYAVGGYVDSDSKTYTAKDGELAFIATKAGKYTVEASIDGTELKDTATLTITDTFADATSKTAYYYDAVKWAKTNEISNGVGDNTFGVNKTITRKEFVTWLYKVAQKSNKLTDVKGDASSLKFTDVPKDSYYAEAVAWGAANGIVYGTSDTTFNPNGEVTRAQAITFIWRLAGKPDSGAAGTQLDATTKFSDVSANQFFTTAVTWGVNTEAYGTTNAKIVSGTSTSTFSPATTCNRAQAMSFIYRAFGADVQ